MLHFFPKHCFWFSGTVTWFWRMWRRCGQRFQRAGRGRRSLSLWTRIAIFLKCSCGVTLSSSCWEILWSPENELCRSFAWGVLEPFSHVFFMGMFFSADLKWAIVWLSITGTPGFVGNRNLSEFFILVINLMTKLQFCGVFFFLKIECKFYSLSSNNHHSRNSPHQLKMSKFAAAPKWSNLCSA